MSDPAAVLGLTPDFTRIFTPGTSFSYEDDGQRGTLSVVEVGELGLSPGWYCVDADVAPRDLDLTA